MAIKYLLLVSRQGKVRLTKWFVTLSPKDKQRIVKDVTALVLSRRSKMCNFIEYRDTKIAYRRYASLFFITGINQDDNELMTLEIIHRYVELLDRYFGNETSKKAVLRTISNEDQLAEQSAVPTTATGIVGAAVDTLARGGSVQNAVQVFASHLSSAGFAGSGT